MIVLKDCLVFGTVQAVSFHGVIWLSNHFLGSFQTCWVSSLAGYQEKLIYLSNKPARQLKEKVLCGGNSCFSSENRIAPGFLCFQGLKIVASIWCWECWKLDLRDLDSIFGQYWEEKLIWQEGGDAPPNQPVIRGCGRCSSWCRHELPVTSFLSPATFEQDQGGTLFLAGRGREWRQAYQDWACRSEARSWILMSFLAWEKVKLGFTSWPEGTVSWEVLVPYMVCCGAGTQQPSTCGMAKKSWNTFLYKMVLKVDILQ